MARNLFRAIGVLSCFGRRYVVTMKYLWKIGSYPAMVKFTFNVAVLEDKDIFSRGEECYEILSFFFFGINQC